MNLWQNMFRRAPAPGPRMVTEPSDKPNEFHVELMTVPVALTPMGHEKIGNVIVLQRNPSHATLDQDAQHTANSFGVDVGIYRYEDDLHMVPANHDGTFTKPLDAVLVRLIKPEPT